MRVLFLQFLKGSWHYGELDAARALDSALNPPAAPAGSFASLLEPDPTPGSGLAPSVDTYLPANSSFVIKQLGRGFVKVGGAETDPEDLRLVEAAWNESAEAILSGDWDLVVLERSTTPSDTACSRPKSSPKPFVRKPEMTHVILTGRNAHPLLIELADTVTEMREVKHAYQKGILAQRGIEFW